MRIFVIVAALLGLSPLVEDPDELDQLLRQIDSDNIAERETATHALIQLGLPARARIDAVSKAGSSEAKGRLKRVLEAINSGVEFLPKALEAILTEHAG